ncbi:hypothetical protein G647_10291 [Cladophialophora carrionii CBS 160.54]|uniref:Uncharacterized protein n=1 Tax=Cladophialophora carrionii CBS 160.54 TaxID=1279043 RepID=V9DIZ2_9EURO|nr:uncharacterized protein G647_10291 [Cladophialophora carrionii CBS 160.54]ETI26845.1 hypothetical protein G647_10291 [Cladophialophora carrionii CBS 160.54]
MTNHFFVMDFPMNNLEQFQKNPSEPQPSVYCGAAPSVVYPRVRTDMGLYIVPSEADTSHPAAPEIF